MYTALKVGTSNYYKVWIKSAAQETQHPSEPVQFLAVQWPLPYLAVFLGQQQHAGQSGHRLCPLAFFPSPLLFHVRAVKQHLLPHHVAHISSFFLFLFAG